jgi:type VI secretion system protein ImpA
MLDLQSLLQPVTADAPSGPKLEHRTDYIELERAATGKPERQMGDAIVPGEPPDWSAVLNRSQALLKESKDLRVAIYLLRALLQTGGFQGFAEGVTLLRQLLAQFWDGLHPELDAEDNNDPTTRITAMMGLIDRQVIQALRAAPLIRSRAFGTVSLRDVENASQPGAAAEVTSSLEGAFQEITVDELKAAAAAVDLSATESNELASAWSGRLPNSGPDFTELRKLLYQANTLMKQRLAARQEAQTGEAPIESGGVAPTPSARGPVRSREDVVRALDGICAYYARNEPSSPVPLLLERCKRLVTMSFLDIVKDMVPDGLTTIQTIAGKQDA